MWLFLLLLKLRYVTKHFHGNLQQCIRFRPSHRWWYWCESSSEFSAVYSQQKQVWVALLTRTTSDVSHPAKQGLVQALGVFVDTFLVCTSTAFIVLCSGLYKGSNLQGIELTQQALSSQIGSWASTFLAIIIFLFAFSSLLGNYYYGETNIAFIKESKTWLMIYRVAVVGMVFFGSIAPSNCLESS